MHTESFGGTLQIHLVIRSPSRISTNITTRMPVWSLTGTVALGWLAGSWLLWRVPGLDTRSNGRGGGPRAGSLAVVIPARNEEQSMPLLP